MNILELLQQYQAAQRSPSMTGPVMPQQLQPGFRAPAVMQMQAPPPPQQQGFNVGDAMGMFGAGLGALKHPAGWVPSTSGSEPGRTAGDADLAGYGASPADPMSGNRNAVPQITPNPQDPHEQAIQQALNQAYAQNRPDLLHRAGRWLGLF
jgi:hypothetical protein